MKPGLGLEPPDGDFVAYVERLQREALARHVASHARPGSPTAALPATAPTPHLPRQAGGATRPESRPALGAEEARELLARLKVSSSLRPGEVAGMIAIALGVMLILATLGGGGGPFGFFIGIALVVWGAKRLESRTKKPPQ